jgi:hypothetical protein
MKENSWNFEKAYSYVRARRSVICPNYGFVKQLKKYAEKLGTMNGDEDNEEKAIEFNPDDFDN